MYVHYEEGDFSTRTLAWYGYGAGAAFIRGHGARRHGIIADTGRSSTTARLFLFAERTQPGRRPMDSAQRRTGLGNDAAIGSVRALPQSIVRSVWSSPQSGRFVGRWSW